MLNRIGIRSQIENKKKIYFPGSGTILPPRIEPPLNEPTRNEPTRDIDDIIEVIRRIQIEEKIVATPPDDIKDDPEAEAEDDDESQNFGQIISVKDGVAFISGLRDIPMGSMVKFLDTDLMGMVLNLEAEQIGAIIFGDDTQIKQDGYVTTSDNLVTTTVGSHLLGRVVDGLGNIIDGKGFINDKTEKFNVERKAPGVITRESVTEQCLLDIRLLIQCFPSVEVNVN